MHIEVLSISATAPSTGAAAAAVAGDSLTIKNGKGKVRVLAGWARNQTVGFAQVAFPSGHDTTRGYRAEAPVGANLGIVPLGLPLFVQPQELLAVTIAGSAVAGDVEQLSMLMHYEDLPGVSGRLITASQVESRMERLTTIESSLISTAGPSYGTPEAINADSDLLLANRDYAIIGATVRTACQSVYLVGPDTANLRIAVPGDPTKPEITSQWFMLLSRAHGLATVPVINSGNRTSTNIGVTCDENAGTFLVSWHLALLK